MREQGKGTRKKTSFTCREKGRWKIKYYAYNAIHSKCANEPLLLGGKGKDYTQWLPGIEAAADVGAEGNAVKMDVMSKGADPSHLRK